VSVSVSTACERLLASFKLCARSLVHGGLFQHTADQVQAGKYEFAVLFQTTRKCVPLSIRTEAKVQGVFFWLAVCVFFHSACVNVKKQCLSSIV
jgi:hypothetical protein